MCLAGTVVALLSLTQVMAGSKYLTVMAHICVTESLNSMKTLGKTQLMFLLVCSQLDPNVCHSCFNCLTAEPKI